MDTIITFVCIFGIICAILTIFLNINLVFRVVLNKSKRTDEMILFYYRFVLDIFFGFCLFLYILYIQLSINYPDFMSPYRPLIVYLALPWSNFGACRSIIALSISLERVLAAFFPMRYRTIKVNFPNWIILSIGVTFGLSEWPFLFEICDYDMQFSSSCRVFGCAMNKCFYNFWTGHKTVIFSSIVVLSIVLSVKLFIWNHLKNHQKNQKLSRANRLALLDTVTVLIFDFLPSFCGNLWPTFPLFNFDNVGPYNAVGKVIGCAIEASVVSSVLLKTRKTEIHEKSSSRKATMAKTSEKSQGSQLRRI